jgi:3-hydroxyisobutyrate dehydrogenase-like beta-hydroxyacid dehydrogenase
MTSPIPAQAPSWLITQGVSIIGTGVMGAAYATRLSALGVPVTVFNRTPAKAVELAKKLRNVKVAATASDCARATPNILVACSPTHECIAAICEQIGPAVRDRNVTFIVDSGLPQAKIMEDVLFERAKAASVTNAAMFGAAFAVVDGSGTLINASGKADKADTVTERVLPLLGLFGVTSYHAGGTATAAHFTMGGHLSFMPMFYGLMHYLAVMRRSGVSSQVALEFFQATGKAVLDGFAPLLAPAFESHDYGSSPYIASHQLGKEVYECVAETCRTLHVDDGLARLMLGYHERAMRDPRLAAQTFQSANDIIAAGLDR